MYLTVQVMNHANLMSPKWKKYELKIAFSYDFRKFEGIISKKNLKIKSLFDFILAVLLIKVKVIHFL